MATRPMLLHVYQARIRANAKLPAKDRLPPIIIRAGRDRRYANAVALLVDGREVGRLVYSPAKPLSCGARLWLSWDGDLEIRDDPEP